MALVKADRQGADLETLRMANLEIGYFDEVIDTTDRCRLRCRIMPS